MLQRFAVLLTLATLPAIAQKAAPPATVPAVDLHRYSGQWYEIARNENRWENKCASDIVVHYEAKPDGGMSLSNTCTKRDGSSTSSHASAKVVDKQSNAKLKVTFFWPFTADYWIIALDPEYRWAVVGQPDREYIWVIARSPSLPKATMNTILQKVEASGYKPSDLIYTKQSKANAAAQAQR